MNPLDNLIPEHPNRHVFSLSDRNVWCASPIRDVSGQYHLFFSNWPKSLGHEAWVTHSQISRAVSDSPLGPWRDCGPVFPANPEPAVWDPDVFHNPHVVEMGGRYFLYYTGTRGSGFWRENAAKPSMDHPEWWVNRNGQRVGVAYADELEGPWTRMEQPLISPPPDYRMTATPFALSRPDGTCQIVFKAVREEPGEKGGPVRHFVALGNHPLGPFQILEEPMLAGTQTGFPIDDHCEWFQAGHYWCLAKDHGENFAGPSPYLFLLESPDGISWKPVVPYFVIHFVLNWADGTTTRFERLEMPKFLFDRGRPQVLYLAAKPENEEESYCIQIPLGGD